VVGGGYPNGTFLRRWRSHAVRWTSGPGCARGSAATVLLASHSHAMEGVAAVAAVHRPGAALHPGASLRAPPPAGASEAVATGGGGGGIGGDGGEGGGGAGPSTVMTRPWGGPTDLVLSCSSDGASPSQPLWVKTQPLKNTAAEKHTREVLDVVAHAIMT